MAPLGSAVMMASVAATSFIFSPSTMGDYDSDDDEVPMLVRTGAPTQAVVEEQHDELPPCPVTILSGFLGSGKTTLIQYILKSPHHGKRIAVIENEFGGSGKEGLSVETIIARDGANQDNLSDLIELPNGCICCTVKDSLVATLENLLEKRKNLDYILIEASGMANPGPIASLFWLDEALESRLRLDGVVTLVDAYHVQRQLRETQEAAQQIAYADRILLNKIDLIDADVETRAVESICAIHPTVPIRNTTYSQVPDLDWILDANCYDADRAKDVDLALSEIEQHDHCHDHASCLDPSCEIDHTAPPSHTHTSSVGTVALVEEASVDLSLVNKWLASILWPNQDEQDKVLRARLEQDDGGVSDDKKPSPASDGEMQLFRIKGILSVCHGDDDVQDEDEAPYINDSNGLDSRRFIVQAVHDLWEIHPASDDLQWDAGEDRTSKLVLIGRFLREDELRAGFQACFMENAKE